MAVGELEFAAPRGGDGFEHVEDARGEDVAADDGVLRGSVFELWFFDHVLDIEEARVFGVGDAVEDAVGGDGGPSMTSEARMVDWVSLRLRPSASCRGQRRRRCRRGGERQGFVADELFGLRNGVAEARGVRPGGDR